MLFNLRSRKDLFYAAASLVLLSIPALLSLNSKTQLQVIRESGLLRVITTNTPSTYYIDKGKPAGFEYELSKAFADFLGVDLKIDIADNLAEVFTTMKQRDAHIAAAMLTVTADRLRSFEFSPPYIYSSATLIYRITQGRQPPANLSDLEGRRLTVIADSSYAELLQRLAADHPGLSWETTDDAAPVDLMEAVHQRSLDFTVLDENSFNAQRSFFPGVNSAFHLNDPQPIAWMQAPHPDQSLKRALARFFQREETQQLIRQLQEKYFARKNALDFFDTVTFKNDFRERLPELEPHFRTAEQETGLSWRLLAAIAYQESHWNPQAVSPTGVRGIMMLTRDTAREMGVSDRTNPQQSIIGGAHYLTQVLAKIPERIPEPDRTWLALAGYNIGFGHLEDARILTQRAGKNPDRWDDVKKFLPLLTKPQYYKSVKRGYARGYEPVTYVRNIRKYMALLNWETQLRHIRQKKAAEGRIVAEESIDRSKLVEQFSPAL